MNERLQKFLIALVLGPVLAVGMLVLSVFMLLLPIVAIVAPEMIKLNLKKDE